MDMPVPIESNYEYQIKQEYKERNQVKKLAYEAMKKIEGWCPEDKASVLMDLIFNHQPDVVVEIGVYGGKSLIPMAMALKHLEKGTIYGIDPWDKSDSVIGFNDENYSWWEMLDHKKIMDAYLSKVKELELEDYVETIRETSRATSPIYGIDLLHIDGNHSEDSAYFDVTKWVPLVKKGGFIIFDDLNWGSTEKAVNWLNENCYQITTFYPSNIWGIWVKL